MIKIHINGNETEVPSRCSIADLLRQLEINNRYCAVERNRELVPREEHEDCTLLDGDSIEVVTLVGGG